MEYGVREKVNHRIQTLGKTKSYTRPRIGIKTGKNTKGGGQEQFSDAISTEESFD